MKCIAGQLPAHTVRSLAALLPCVQLSRLGEVCQCVWGSPLDWWTVLPCTCQREEGCWPSRWMACIRVCALDHPQAGVLPVVSWFGASWSEDLVSYLPYRSSVIVPPPVQSTAGRLLSPWRAQPAVLGMDFVLAGLVRSFLHRLWFARTSSRNPQKVLLEIASVKMKYNYLKYTLKI